MREGVLRDLASAQANLAEWGRRGQWGQGGGGGGRQGGGGGGRQGSGGKDKPKDEAKVRLLFAAFQNSFHFLVTIFGLLNRKWN